MLAGVAPRQVAVTITEVSVSSQTYDGEMGAISVGGSGWRLRYEAQQRKRANEVPLEPGGTAGTPRFVPLDG